MRELDAEETFQVSGVFFWIALPIILAGGYTLGKDRATRDNASDEANK